MRYVEDLAREFGAPTENQTDQEHAQALHDAGHIVIATREQLYTPAGYREVVKQSLEAKRPVFVAPDAWAVVRPTAPGVVRGAVRLTRAQASDLPTYRAASALAEQHGVNVIVEG